MRYLNISFLRKMGGQIDELVSVSRNIKPSDTKNANVIMDFADKKVVKCIIEDREHDTTFEQLRDYYNRIYPQLVEQLEQEAVITKEQEKQSTKVSLKKKK